MCASRRRNGWIAWGRAATPERLCPAFLRIKGCLVYSRASSEPILRRVLSSRPLCAALLACLLAAGLAGCGRRGPLEPPEGSASAAVPKTVSEVPPQVTTPSAGLATEPLEIGRAHV